MSTKRNLGESSILGKNFRKLSFALKDGSVGISHLSQAVKDLIERGGDVPKDLIDIIIEMVNERMSSYATRAEVVNLQSQIDVINMRISGISITLNPRSQPVYAGNLATIDINVTTTDRASAIRLYRGDIPIYESSTETVTWSYTDIFTPASETMVVYRVVAIVGGVEKEATTALSVVKQEANIMWSSDEATVIMDTTNNFPYLSNINNLPVTYETSNANVATVNALGTVTLVGAGAANIIARFDGDNIYNPCIARYTLTVQENSINTLLWSGAEILPNTLSIGDTATLYKGTVLACYQSGRVEDVTDRSSVTAASGNLSGDIYTATAVGTDILSVRFGNIVSRNTLVVNVRKVPTNIHWSAEEYTASIGGSNEYPSLLGVETGMEIYYRSSNESVADIDSNGRVILVSQGTCIITASFGGDATREASQDSYKLTVANDSVVSVSWAGGSVEPSTINVGGIAALTKGTVIATYASGRTENVTNSAEFDADRGKIHGNVYTAPDTIGEDTISVSYGGKTASSTIQINVIEQTYTVSLTVVNGTKTPDSDITVNAGGNASWTIEPDDGYQLPIGVAGAELIGNIVNVTNIQADGTYIAECQPVESHLAVQFGHGTSYNDAEWVTVGQLTDNLSVHNISNAYGEYLFIKYDKRDTVNNLWIDSDIPSSIDLDEPIVDGDYKYRRSEIRGASLAPIDYIINKV